MTTERHNAGAVEPRWQQIWAERGTFSAPNEGAQVLLGGSAAFTIFGSLIVLAAMALFAWIVFRTAPI